MNSIWFRAWVANTVHELSGIWCLDWQGSQRKCALTPEEIRAAACQGGLRDFFEDELQGSARPARLGATNQSANRRKLH